MINIYYKDEENNIHSIRALDQDHAEKLVKFRISAGIYMQDIEYVQVYTLEMLTEIIHQNAKDKGFWNDKKSTGDIIALMHTELSEAFEEYRNNKPLHYIENGKPEGFAVELADVIIRILDWAGHEKIDMEKIILEKHKYNATRPFMHGGKKL